MPLIKILLILAAVGLLLLAFHHRGRVGLRAGWRIVSLLLVVAAVVFVINPDIPQALAELVGVTRGTDLVLYVLIIVFVFTTLGMYLRLREMDQRFVELARHVAIEAAVERTGGPDPGSPDPGSPGSAISGRQGDRDNPLRRADTDSPG